MNIAPPARIVDKQISGADRIVCWFLRHWLLILLVPMLLFVSLPFFAPVAMHFGWTRAGKLLYTFYAPFCHQLPQRSWFFFGPALTYNLDTIASVANTTDPFQLRHFYGSSALGWKVAWSDRMISFYFMVPAFAASYWFLRQLGVKIRPLSIRVLLLAMSPLVLDGLTHLTSDLFFGISSDGFRDTNTWLAVVTQSRYPLFYAGDHFGTFNWWMRLISGLLAAWAVTFTLFPFLDDLMAKEVGRECGVIVETGCAS